MRELNVYEIEQVSGGFWINVPSFYYNFPSITANDVCNFGNLAASVGFMTTVATRNPYIAGITAGTYLVNRIPCAIAYGSGQRDSLN